MKNIILVGFLSLWIFSILTPSVLSIFSKGEETIMVLCHKEGEQQETAKKDSLEEKIIPESNQHILESDRADKSIPEDKYTTHSISHIMEIQLPPPERII